MEVIAMLASPAADTDQALRDLNHASRRLQEAKRAVCLARAQLEAVEQERSAALREFRDAGTRVLKGAISLGLRPIGGPDGA